MMPYVGSIGIQTFGPDGRVIERTLPARSTHMWYLALLSTVLTLGLVTNLAQAEVLSYTAPVDAMVAVRSGMVAPPTDLLLNVPRFDSSLGTLTGIQLSVQLSGDGLLYVTNHQATSATLSGYFVMGAELTTVQSSAPYVTGTTWSNLNGTIPAAPEEGGIGTGLVHVNASDTYYSSPPLATEEWIGTGGSGDAELRLRLFAYLNANLQQQGLEFSNNDSASMVGGLLVSYQYDPTPVPLPGTPWLFTSGIAGLVLLRRRWPTAVS
jgi:hypothetical protein